LKLVVDASVIVKWALPDPNQESHVDRALALLDEIQAGKIDLLQPPHWMAEVAGVLTRLRPAIVDEVIDLMSVLKVQVVTDPVIFKRASRIAQDLGKHVFDSLYHAVALEYGVVLVSADSKYYLKARRLGSLIPLAIWKGSEAVLKGREG
jgi:predicted nucleic acid-binding protein